MTQTLFNQILDRLILYQLLATLFTYLAIKVIFFYYRRAKRFGLMRQYGIPMADTSLWYGHFHLYRQNKAYFLVDEEFKRRFGKVYGIFMGDEPGLVVSDEELLSKIFFDHIGSFQERSRTFVKTPLSDGVLFAQRDRWKYLRSIMLPHFSAYNVGSNLSIDFIENSVRQLLDYIDLKHHQAVKNKQRLEINLENLMKATALHVVSALAVQLPDVQVREDEPYIKGLDQFLAAADNGLVNYVIMFPFLKIFVEFLANNFEYNKMLAATHQTLNRLIDCKISKSEQARQSVLMDHMVKLHREGKITRSELLACADSVLFAGYDTTANTLSSIFWVLGSNQEIQDKLRHELKAYGVESEYLMQIIKETMRCYPPVISFTTRLATETVVIDGLVIPQGVKVICNNWLMHRSPQLWPEPEKFDPDRFAKDKTIHPCAFAPFGLGERRCLGYQLTLHEMKLILCNLLLRYKVITLAPPKLEQVTHAVSLSKPKEPVLLELQKL